MGECGIQRLIRCCWQFLRLISGNASHSPRWSYWGGVDRRKDGNIALYPLGSSLFPCPTNHLLLAFVSDRSDHCVWATITHKPQTETTRVVKGGQGVGLSTMITHTSMVGTQKESEARDEWKTPSDLGEEDHTVLATVLVHTHCVWATSQVSGKKKQLHRVIVSSRPLLQNIYPSMTLLKYVFNLQLAMGCPAGQGRMIPVLEHSLPELWLDLLGLTVHQMQLIDNLTCTGAVPGVGGNYKFWIWSLVCVSCAFYMYASFLRITFY